MGLNAPQMPLKVLGDMAPKPDDGRTISSSAKPSRLIRLPMVEDRTGLKKSTIYAAVKSQTFPAPLRLTGGRAVAWREEDIDRWIADRATKGGLL